MYQKDLKINQILVFQNFAKQKENIFRFMY